MSEFRITKFKTDMYFMWLKNLRHLPHFYEHLYEVNQSPKSIFEGLFSRVQKANRHTILSSKDKKSQMKKIGVLLKW